MKIFLFRHGNKQQINSTNCTERRSVALSELGIRQASKLGDYLKSHHPSLQNQNLIFSSPFPRTIQTAEIVRNKLSIKRIEVIAEFQEFYAYNDYVQYENSRELQAKAFDEPNWVAPQTNISLDQYVEKYFKVIKKLFLDDYKELIISTHGGAIKGLVYKLKPELKPNGLDIIAKPIQETGLTILNYENSTFDVEQFNGREHLKES